MQGTTEKEASSHKKRPQLREVMNKYDSRGQLLAPDDDSLQDTMSNEDPSHLQDETTMQAQTQNAF